MMYNRFRRIKESYDTLDEDIAFILFDREWEGTTLYEAYKSGEFDDDEGYDPLDRLVDEVCEILDRNPDEYDVPEFETMEEETRFFKKVRQLVANALNLNEFLEKRKTN